MKWQLKLGLLAALLICGDIRLRAQTVVEQQPQADTPVTKTATPTPVVTPRVIRPQKPKPLSKEFSGGLRLNSDGWSIFFDKGWVAESDERESDKFYNLKLAQIEFSEHKHPKELKETNPNQSINPSDKPKKFIYGKINNFYALKLGYGRRKMIAGKPDPGTVSVHWVYLGGLSVGLAKPYYVDAYVPQDNPVGTMVKKAIKYDSENKTDFLRHQYIVGGSGWSKGLDETKFIPGIHAKTGLHFDFAPSLKTVLALEVGVSGELYTQKIELMANQEAQAYLINAYVSLQFGKRK